MPKTLVEKTAEYVKKQLAFEKTGHDWYHVYRVWQVARLLQQHEGGDLELVELATLLHSAAEPNFRENNEHKRSLAMWGMLDVLEIEEHMKEKIIAIAHQCRFKGAHTERPGSLEGKIVQDANWLDGLGAIGIARVFTAGGFYGRLIHDPDLEPAQNQLDNTAYQKRKLQGTSINYFYDKSLQVVDRLNTATAKQIAAKRVQYIKDFLREFQVEWENKDLADLDHPEPAGVQFTLKQL